MGCLCVGACAADAPATCRKLLPVLVRHLVDGPGHPADVSENELEWHLQLAGHVCRAAGPHLLPYRGDVEQLLAATWPKASDSTRKCKVYRAPPTPPPPSTTPTNLGGAAVSELAVCPAATGSIPGGVAQVPRGACVTRAPKSSVRTWVWDEVTGNYRASVIYLQK